MLYSMSLSYMLILSKITFTGTSRLVFDQLSGYHGLAELARKVNHQNL